jgi:hypothetical protein
MMSRPLLSAAIFAARHALCRALLMVGRDDGGADTVVNVVNVAVFK